MSDTAKTPEQSASDRLLRANNELPAKAIGEQDAEAVNGGATLNGKIIEPSPIISAYMPQHLVTLCAVPTGLQSHPSR